MSILVSIDASQPTRAAVRLATVLGRARQLPLVLLHVHPGAEPADLDLLADLHDLAEPIRRQGVAVHLRLVSGDPVTEVRHWAQRLGAELVVTGTRGAAIASGPDERSFARRLMLSAELPVVAVRPGGVDHLSSVHLVGRTSAAAEGFASDLAGALRLDLTQDEAVPAPVCVDSAAIGEDDALIVVPFDPACEWSEWCGSLVARAAGTVALVGGPDCGCSSLMVPALAPPRAE